MKLLLRHRLLYAKSEKAVVPTAHRSMTLVRGTKKPNLQFKSCIQLWHRKVNFCSNNASEQITLIKCLHSSLVTQYNKFAFYKNLVRLVQNRKLWEAGTNE